MVGFCVGMVLLPVVGPRRWRWQLVLGALALLSLLAVFISLPLVFFLRQFPGICCGDAS